MAFASCSDTEEPQIGATITSPVLQQLLPQNLVINEETNLTDPIGHWVWNAADYGIPTQITYTIEADTLGGTFEKPIVLTSSNGLSAVINAGMLNKAAANFITETSLITLDVRLKTTVSPAVEPVYSNIQPVTFTAFIAVKTPLYIVGNALVGWDNSPGSIGNNLQVFFSDDSNAGNPKFTYTGYFNAGSDKGFKLITKAGDWGTAYAYINGGLSPNNAGNKDFPAPATNGIYTLNVDLNALTYSLDPYTKPVVSYDKIGMIGDGAKGWGDTDDIVMTKFAEHVWVINSVDLKPGGVKFRIIKSDGNGDWGTNWGMGDIPEMPFGISKAGGADFVIEKTGTYFVALNDLTGHYVIIEKSKLP